MNAASTQQGAARKPRLPKIAPLPPALLDGHLREEMEVDAAECKRRARAAGWYRSTWDMQPRLAAVRPREAEAAAQTVAERVRRILRGEAYLTSGQIRVRMMAEGDARSPDSIRGTLRRLAARGEVEQLDAGPPSWARHYRLRSPAPSTGART